VLTGTRCPHADRRIDPGLRLTPVTWPHAQAAGQRHQGRDQQRADSDRVAITPAAIVIAICPNCSSGITASMARLAARAIPAVVMAREAVGTAMATAAAGA
jgi:hypothetical protein